LAVGASTTTEIAYYGTDTGDFSSIVSIESNAGIGTISIYTNQLVGIETVDFLLSQTENITTTTVWGMNSTTDVSILALKNGVAQPETILDFSTAISGHAGWSITTGTNRLSITFDPDRVENVNGTYTSTIVVVSGESTHEILNTAYVNIDYAKYKNLATWISPAAAYNSVIGMSLDLVDGNKTLTIGVGVGGDSTPQYGRGGQPFAELDSLGYKAASLDMAFPYWANVYVFTLTDTPGTYLSGQRTTDGNLIYEKKTTAGQNYADYFGFEQSEGSIFIVDHDGAGNITVEINNLRELSGDEDFDATMQNITRAFYYYSAIDQVQRYYNLEPAVNTNLTHLFRGFITSYNPNTDQWTWSVDVSTVPVPT